MAGGPRPLGGTKNIRIPAGKEDEYSKTRQGQIIHTKYGTDEELDAVVVPSGKPLRTSGGGSHDPKFDPLGRDIPQHIVTFGEDGIQQVTQTTGREMVRKARVGEQTRDDSVSVKLSEEEADQLGHDAEAEYLRMAKEKGRSEAPSVPAAAPAVSAALVAQVTKHIEEGLVPTPKKKTKKAKKKKTGARGKTSQRGVESGETPAEPQAQEENYLPIKVEIEGPFGRLEQTFSGIFQDGICLVLYTDRRHVTSLYTLPPPSGDDAMPITITYQSRVIKCLWAGIQFTMPHAPVTFMVLLVTADEEPTDAGEGQSSQGWPHQM